MQYFKELNSKFNFISTFIESIILGYIIFVVDKTDIPSGTINNNILIAKEVAILSIIFVLIVFILERQWNLFRDKSINLMDKILFNSLFVELFGIIDYIYLYSYWKNIIFVVILFTIILIVIRVIIYKSVNLKNKKK